jgi:hypothetical protein
MSDELNNRVLELIARLDSRAARLEEGFQALIELGQNHDGQLDDIRSMLNRLGEAQIRTEDALARLADAQAHTDGRLDALIDIVRGMRGEQG